MRGNSDCVDLVNLGNHFMKLLAKCLITPGFCWTRGTFLTDIISGKDRLTPVSVAVTDQMIGLFISALCVLHVIMH